MKTIVSAFERLDAAYNNAGGIVWRLDLREALEAGGVDPGDSALNCDALDNVFDLIA